MGKIGPNAKPGALSTWVSAITDHDNIRAPLEREFAVEVFSHKGGLFLPRHPRWPLWRIFLFGLSIGTLSGGICWVKLHVAVKCFQFLLGPTIAACFLYARVRSTWPWYIFAAGHGLGWLPWFYFGPGSPGAGSVALLGERIAVAASAWMFVSMAVAVTCIFLGSLILPKLRHPIVPLDRTRCPNCRYSLIGNISGTCPECGYAFAAELPYCFRSAALPSIR